MLRLSHATAADLLGESIEQGKDLLERASLIGDQSDYESWKTTRKQWIERTAEALNRIYDGPQEALDFKSEASSAAGGQQWQIEYKRDSNCVRAAIDILISLQAGIEREPAADGELERDDPADAELERKPAADTEYGRYDPAGSEHEREHAASAVDEHEPTDSRLEHEQEREHEHEPAHEPESAGHAEPADLRGAVSEHEDEPVERPLEGEAPARGFAPVPAPTVGADLAPTPSDGERSENAGNGSMSSLPATRSPEGPGTDRTSQVFLVHGRNDGVKQAVAGLLERSGPHEVTILNERPSDRRMLIEQCVEHAAESRYAVVLLTADDVGAPRLDSAREPYFSPRARQGVVFEMGVLVAALTPRCICVLYEDGVELPCDLDGIAYVRLDLAGTWQSKLLLHLRAAGFDYDLNSLAPI
jgi:Predicted nucleotide-binding protein containing TIR-like domain